MISGRRSSTASAVTIRARASASPARSAKQSVPPAISISSLTQPIPVINGSSHSSKKTRDA
jgi:hypothetical protein